MCRSFRSCLFAKINLHPKFVFNLTDLPLVTYSFLSKNPIILNTVLIILIHPKIEKSYRKSWRDRVFQLFFKYKKAILILIIQEGWLLFY